MTKENVKQHYVPQFYLRLFSSNAKGNSVFCYDKKTTKTFKIKIKKICYENGFYENENKKKKPIEDAFSFADKEASRLFNKVIDAEDLSVLNMNELSSLICCLLLLKQRTRKRRNIVRVAREEWLENINRKFSDWKIVPTSENWEQSEHLLSIIETQKEELKRLCKNNWMLILNKTKIPFWTSDDPLIQQLVNNDKRFNEPYVLNYFPLTPNILMLSQPLFSRNIRFFKTEVTDENIINHCNRLTVKNANRFVISKINDFSDNPLLNLLFTS